jgi:hypothetical protein
MKWGIKLMLIVLLSSCSAQWHLKKAVQKDPFILERDTMVVRDTVVVPPVVITDTVTTRQHDTIVVEKDRLKVRIVKKLDTLIIDAKCDSDTIVKIVEVPYEKIIYQEKEAPLYLVQRWVVYILSAIVGFRILYRLIDRWLP